METIDGLYYCLTDNTATEDPALSDLEQLETTLASRLQQARGALRDWETVLQFETGGRPCFHVVASGGLVEVFSGGHPHPRTILAIDDRGLNDVIAGSIDITHAIARGSVRVVRGDYFDCIFLSKAFRRARAAATA